MNLWDIIRDKGPENPFWDYDIYNVQQSLADLGKREKFVKTVSYAIPSPEAVRRIKDFVGDEKIIEVGAGLGLWARLLQDAGTIITPTDKSLTFNHYIDPDISPYTTIDIKNGTQAVQDFKNHSVLMLIWPPYGDIMAAETLRAFTGSKVIYIGEPDGCTADDTFHKMIYENFEELEDFKIPQWFGIHDRMFLFSRKLEIETPRKRRYLRTAS